MVYDVKDMKNYPTGWKDDHHHLLFDIGYAYALLARIHDLLEDITEKGEYNLPEAKELLEYLTEFQKGRLQEIEKIYSEGYKIELPKK